MIIIEGKLSTEDSKKLSFKEFDVPQDTSALKIEFEYAPTSIGLIQNHVNLLIYDSMGRFMGRYDRGTKQFTIAEHASVAAQRTLPLPGRWKICFENHYLFTDVNYKLIIEFENNSKYRTYIGELHTHTVHSDGTFTVKELADYLKELGFDFFFLTDHSNVTGWREISTIKDIVCFQGQELNTFNGHGLVLGCNTFIDWKNLDGQEKEITQVMNEVHQQYGLMGVAHPFALGDPLCVGCKWMYDFDPFKTDFVEVWNADLSRTELNFEAIGKWIENLRKGRRITATAGRDLHKKSEIDWLKTVVFARELSLSEVLFAIKNGKVILSYTDDVSFTVEDKTSGETVIAKDKVKIKASFGQLGQKNVIVITKKTAKKLGEIGELEMKIDMEPDDFALLIVLGKDNLPLVITNPVFVKRGD
ncbi:CehA/McbA family metallohydrolase [Thermotoga profunda]|uniref:CehA/McbA family metallohydrolase n=1 Tax=Thermotoga profunda TaxID=1508420 RepID=UPI0006932929|nr:CehA/McbA family metallohydrolase [Thermotoga profunda]